MLKIFDRDTQIILKIIFIVLGLWVLWLLKDLVLILLLSLVLTSAMEPMVDYFKLKKIPRSLSVLTVYVVFLGGIGFLISLIAPLIFEQFSAVSSNLPQYISQLEAKFPELTHVFGTINIANLLQNVISFGDSQTGVFSRTIGVFNGFVTFVTVLVISFYLSAEEDGMKKFVKSLVPLHRQEKTYDLISKIQKKMGRWLMGQFVLCFSIFAVTWIGLTLLGVPNALLLAIIAGLLEIVPYIGPILSAVPALLFALLQSPVLAVGVIILYILIQKLEGLILVPKVMQKTIGVSPLVILLALLAGFKLAGIWGLLLAVPLVGIFQVFFTEYTHQDKAS